MKTQLITSKLFTILALVLVIGACKNQKSVIRDVDPTGVYALVSIDGKQVPTELSHEGSTLQIRSGSFTINADGTCSSKIVFVPPGGTEITREVKASYKKDGAQLNMQWERAGTTAGTIKGTTFTMENEGITFLYRK